MTISKSVLKSYGYKARDEYAILSSLNLDGQNIQGCCIDITRYIIQKLHTRTDIDEDLFEKVKCNVKGKEMHYLLRIDSSCVQEYQDMKGYVFVDASIDQFCQEQKEIGRVAVSLGSYDSLERVAIMPPDDPRKDRYEDCITGV